MWLMPIHSLAQGPEVPIPRSVDWVPALLLAILWLFVAAAVAGALVRHFRRRKSAP
jgi:hypothetical protein